METSKWPNWLKKNTQTKPLTDPEAQLNDLMEQLKNLVNKYPELKGALQTSIGELIEVKQPNAAPPPPLPPAGAASRNIKTSQSDLLLAEIQKSKKLKPVEKSASADNIAKKGTGSAMDDVISQMSGELRSTSGTPNDPKQSQEHNKQNDWQSKLKKAQSKSSESTSPTNDSSNNELSNKLKNRRGAIDKSHAGQIEESRKGSNDERG